MALEEGLSEAERARTSDLIRILPKGGGQALDIGARGGRFSRILAEHYQVTALDLVKPPFSIPGVETVAGDVTHLESPDESFDCVFCTEVLEHVPEIERACLEIQRVARRDVVIGVPFRQDLRISRTTCKACGRTSPAWGHVNRFDEKRLVRLFPDLNLITTSYVWPQRRGTNPLAVSLMDLGGNPWGSYDQQEPCVHCGAKLVAPENRGLIQKVCSGAAATLNRLQTAMSAPLATWMHAVFRKKASQTAS